MSETTLQLIFEYIFEQSHSDENDYCTKGSLALVPPYQVCAGGLTCRKNETTEDFQCSEDPEIPCVQESKQYKDGQSTKYKTEKPVCDGDGNYLPLRCNVNQT